MTELRKLWISDETSGDSASVSTENGLAVEIQDRITGTPSKIEVLSDDDQNLDNLAVLLTASVNFNRIDANKVKPARMDAVTHSIVDISYEHKEIHTGKHFFIDSVVDLAINNVYDIQWTTPNTTEWGHFDFKLSCESETSWIFYEGVNIITAGTAIAPVNNNRNSVNVSTAIIAGILNASLVAADADTDPTAAVLIAQGIIGAGKDGGLYERDNEIILKQNTDYCFRLIANTAGYINFNLQWYEHTNLD